jgi:hypothetical protein
VESGHGLSQLFAFLLGGHVDALKRVDRAIAAEYLYLRLAIIEELHFPTLTRKRHVDHDCCPAHRAQRIMSSAVIKLAEIGLKRRFGHPGIVGAAVDVCNALKAHLDYLGSSSRFPLSILLSDITLVTPEGVRYLGNGLPISTTPNARDDPD